jgi:5-(carboxyamino)imidazole ribonucleotide synthase
LFLYGKRGARAGRKMGHLAAVGDSPADALDRVRRAAARL